MDVDADVVVVGAGVAGLTCAASLASQGVRAIILEAQHRLGGRVYTVHPADGSAPAELGAQVVHGDQNPLWQLGSQRPASNPFTDADAYIVLDGIARPMSTLAHWDHPPWSVDARLGTAGNRDVPVRRWLGELPLTGREHDISGEWLRQTWCADLEELSLHGAAAARAGDGVGSGQYCLSEGFDTLIRSLAGTVDVRLRSPAHQVRWRPGHAAVTGAGGTVTARAVAVTVPPPVLASGMLRIDSLPGHKHAAAASIRLGDGLSALATTTTAATRDAVVLDVHGGAGFIRTARGSPHVTMVCKGPAAATLRAAVNSRSAVSWLLARALPWTNGAGLTDLLVADWGADPYSAGAFSYPARNAARQRTHLAAPMANTVFFAGEATCALAEAASVHGAYRSGKRASRQIWEALHA